MTKHMKILYNIFVILMGILAIVVISFIAAKMLPQPWGALFTGVISFPIGISMSHLLNNINNVN